MSMRRPYEQPLARRTSLPQRGRERLVDERLERLHARPRQSYAGGLHPPGTGVLAVAVAPPPQPVAPGPAEGRDVGGQLQVEHRVIALRVVTLDRVGCLLVVHLAQ